MIAMEQADRERIRDRVPTVLFWSAAVICMFCCLGSRARFGPLVIMSAILVGGYFVLQERMLDRDRTVKPFSLELKERIGTLAPENIAFFGQCSDKTMFYLDLAKPLRHLRDADQVTSFLRPDGTTKVLISRSGFMKELVEAFPERVTAEPTLKEKKNPWEKQKDPFVAWIIPYQGT